MPTTVHPTVIKVNVKTINKRKIDLYELDFVEFLYEIFSYKVFNEHDGLNEEIDKDIQECFDSGILSLWSELTINNELEFIAKNDIRPGDEYYIMVDWIYSDSNNYYDYSYSVETKNVRIIRTKRSCYDKWPEIYKLLTGKNNGL